MRLLRTEDYAIEEFAYDDVPEYAILSHRWAKEELTLQDVQGRIFNKQGFNKIQGCCLRAQADKLRYAWVDTCCIDKTSSAELSEAINSMYLWYYKAKRCYAYLADVLYPKASVERSEWFTRGWTLQELLAPSEVYFLDKNWTDLGTRTSLQQTVSRCTGIPPSILSGERGLETVSIAQRMSWAARRETSRVEDGAYCLMGMFGINMPLIYGEGQRAFFRLQEEIMKMSDDHSLFAWESSDARGGLLASSPAAFSGSSQVMQFNPFDTPKSPLTVSSRGVYVDLRFIGCGKQGLGMAILHCKDRGGEDKKPLAIYLRDTSMTMERFIRVRCDKVARLDTTKFRPSQYPIRRLYIHTQRITLTRNADDTGQQDVSDQLYSVDKIRELMDFTNPTALLRAAELGQLDAVWMLLTRRDVDINLRRSDGHTALSLAVENHKGAIVKALLARNDVKTRLESEGGWDLLTLAVASGDVNIVKQLLHSDKVHVNSKGKQGKTALHYAVLSGSVALVKLLLENGLDVEETDASGRRPLHHAVEKGQEAIVRLLVDEGGADIEAEDRTLLTPLLCAIRNGNATIVEFLLRKGAGVEGKGDWYKAPLAYALDGDSDAIVELLVDKGAKRDWRRSGLCPVLRRKWLSRKSSS
ncbi:hypothetical protein L249_6150 [Ophiocordyceps polyrhachis-furcata BCC 54312]|uniref:Uncharacterized protein n=1 Tax=Ophiocordyceps polyrhachis-furcata BCC 54312 TaxID=1330021 RepID=A0A367LIM5_9HYPO|nr:hypothetical protein L249_6150 [Ophiocordyceps polyrhachis-furcata BCC 54312]